MTPRPIPRRIIQTAKTPALSPLAQASACNLKLLHPNWDYCFFDDTDIHAFVRAEFPQYLATFESFPRAIQRIDFFRYLAVLKLGGFYFDLDVLLSRSLEPLLPSGCVFPFEELTLSRYLRSHHGLDWELGNYAFGAAPDHPFLAAVVAGCVEAQLNPAVLRAMMADIPSPFAREYQVLNSTGPGLISRIYAERPDLHSDVMVLFPSDVCDERNWHLFGTIGVHLMDGSWRSRGGLLWRKAANFWETRRRRNLLKESRKIGPRRDFSTAALKQTI